MSEKNWTVEEDGGDLLICGPGELEIVLRDFDPARSMSGGLPEEMTGELRTSSVNYFIEDGVEIELVTVASPDGDGVTKLHVGNYVSWELPAAFGRRLKALLQGLAVQS